MVLQEVQVVEEVFQVELKEQELLVKEILEDVVVHLVHQLRIKLEVAVEVTVAHHLTEVHEVGVDLAVAHQRIEMQEVAVEVAV